MEVKHHNKHLGIIIFLGFMLIVIGIISYVVINYSNDQAEVKKRMEVVINSYDTFKAHVDDFNNIRDQIYNEVMKDMYYQTLGDNDLYYKELFESYSDSLEGIDGDYKEIKNYCINVLYPDASVNNKCEAIIIGYEEVVNIYVSNVKSYNKNISSYNKWLSDNNSSDSKLEKIKLDRDYLDVNGDREYKGKEDVKVDIIDQNSSSLDNDSEDSSNEE